MLHLSKLASLKSSLEEANKLNKLTYGNLVSRSALIEDSGIVKLTRALAANQNAIAAAGGLRADIVERAKLKSTLASNHSDLPSLDAVRSAIEVRQNILPNLDEMRSALESNSAALNSITDITRISAAEQSIQTLSERVQEMSRIERTFNIPELRSTIREDVIFSIHAAEARSKELASIHSASSIAKQLCASVQPITLTLPPRFSSYPSLSAVNHNALMQSFSSRHSSKYNPEDKEDNYSSEELSELLPEEWLRCLIGAKQAINSSNPDKQRHAITSIRELMTAALHFLAPTEKVKPWIPDDRKDFLHNKRPTRKCRLLYICRNIDSEPLDEFVALDIDAMHQFYVTLNGGTHSMGDRFTDRQVRAIIARAEGFLLSLLKISEG